MAWEISMSADGWGQVYVNLLYLAHHEPEQLIEGIASDVTQSGKFDAATDEYEGFSETKYYKAKSRLRKLTAQELAEEAFALIEDNNTCTNGGHEVYLDDQGYVTIPVDLLPGAEGFYEYY